MKRKVLANITSLIFGIFLAFSTINMPHVGKNLNAQSYSELFKYHVQNHWWMMLAFFIFGYMTMFLVFWLFNREINVESVKSK